MNPQSTNHPQKGSIIRVDPIKTISGIKAIKKLLADNSRDLAIFTIGINTNLRGSDLISLQVGQTISAMTRGELVLTEQKTGKYRRITLNPSCVGVLADLLAKEATRRPDAAPLFTSRKNGGALSISYLSRLVKKWCAKVGLVGNYGSHTLRKTWGYHQRVTFGADIPTLMVCFNHSNQRQTLDYLCVQPSEIQAIYANEL